MNNVNNDIKVESVMVSVTYDSDNKVNIMLVGKKKKNDAVEIINAFQGEDAARLYAELTTKKG